MSEPIHIFRPLVMFISIFFSSLSWGQVNDPILLNSGEVTLTINNDLSKRIFENAKEASLGASIKLIQFSEIPTEEVKQTLSLSGITLISYVPKNAYFAQITSSANWQVLVDSKMVAVSDIKSSFKLSRDLVNKQYQDWAKIGDNRIRLNGKFFSSFSKTTIEANLTNIGAKVESINDAQIARFSIDISKLEDAFDLGAFYYFEQIDPPSLPENLVGVTNHRSNTLASSYANGLHYTGNGVTVMLQDNSRLDEHIDYTGRFINDGSATNSGDHGEHCGGIIAGAGNIDPTARGMAYGAEVLVYGSSNNNFNDVPTLYNSSNMRITSKSYGNGTNAGYTTLASELDEQVRLMPELIHVFSGGNSNGGGSTAAGSQWFNVTGGHKAGKNVLAVGNLTRFDVISNSSSRGPSADGRIKPDICAVGSSVYSTIDPNNYGTKSGTSMACPGVAGVLAQLYEAYKDLNGGSNPESALMKASILNTADDLGNSGPDFIYGWGRINARRAFDVLSNNQYFSGNISQGTNISHSITVPAGIEQIRVMVHWSDYEAVPNASQVLVNDINMTVVSPSNVTTNPWILDNTPNSTLLNMPAVQGVDHTNNMEQVTIDTPLPGVYTINLNGFAIPSGPQKYYVVYEMVTDDVVLTYPIGGE
ncbi:MAG: S8 family serine peptidase, partial [Crocinitomicaceae bacterium]